MSQTEKPFWAVRCFGPGPVALEEGLNKFYSDPKVDGFIFQITEDADGHYTVISQNTIPDEDD